MNLDFVCSYVMPATIGFMFVGIIIGLQSLSNGN